MSKLISMYLLQNVYWKYSLIIEPHARLYLIRYGSSILFIGILTYYNNT